MADTKDPKDKILNYINYLSENESLTLPTGLSTEHKTHKFDYDKHLEKLAKTVRAEKYEDKVSFFRTYEAFDDHFLIINDVILADVPILYNKIRSTNDVFVAETLRSVAPVVSSSGRQNWILQLGLLFKPGDTQTKTLHRLVSVLQRFPITYIYNRRIRKALAIHGGDEINTIFILESASMRNASDAVGSISLDLTFHLFNYKPFSNHFWYNTKLPGYSRTLPEYDLSKRLIDARGYEPSEYSIKNEAIALHESLRELPDFLGETSNVPVPFPSSSDSWNYYADHLQKMTPEISENTNDYVELNIKYFRQYKPPIPETRVGGDNAKHAQESSFEGTPYHSFYNALSSPETTATDRKVEKAKQIGKGQKIKGKGSKRMKVLIPFIQKYAKQYGISPEYVYAVIKRESGGNPSSSNKYTKAAGLGQIMPKTWEHKDGSGLKKRLGVDWPFSWLSSSSHVPEQIQAICFFVKELGTNAFNSFPGNISKWGEDHIKLIDLYYSYGSGITKSFFKRKAIPLLGSRFTMRQVESAFQNIDFKNFAVEYWTRIGNKKKINYWKEKYGVRPISHMQGTWKDVERVLEANLFDSSFENSEETISLHGTSQEQMQQIEERKRKEYEKAKEEQLAVSSGTKENIIKEEIIEKESSDFVLRDAKLRKLWIEKMEDIGIYHYKVDKQLRNIFYKDLRFAVDSETQSILSGEGGIVLSAVSVGFGHRIAAQKLLSQDTPTYQFLGAGNKQGALVFTFSGSKGRAAADEIKKIVYAARENARVFGALIPEAGTITLGLQKQKTTNNILSLIAKKQKHGNYFLDIVVSEIQESTSQNNADAYELVLEFVVQEFSSDKGLDRNFGTLMKNKQKFISNLLEKYVIPSPLEEKIYEWNQWIKPHPSFIVERYHGSAELLRKGQGALNKRGAFDEAEKFKVNHIFMRNSGYARPYRLKDNNMPIWVANVIIAAAEVCRKADNEAPPTNWRDPSGKRWFEYYNDWGADFIKGRRANIDKWDHNGLAKFTGLTDQKMLYYSLATGGTPNDIYNNVMTYEEWLDQPRTHSGRKQREYELASAFNMASKSNKAKVQANLDKLRRQWYKEDVEHSIALSGKDEFKGRYDWDFGRSDLSKQNKLNTSVVSTKLLRSAHAGTTDKDANRVFQSFLDGMEKVYQMAVVNMADEENFKHYFGSFSDELYDNLISDLGGCYDDLHVPNRPPITMTVREEGELKVVHKERKLELPLPPEFFIYDDSYEDPALSSLRDPANMEQHLYEHIDNEIKSVARYIKNSICGGSYLSRNLPNIAKQRKRYLDEFGGKNRINEWAGEMGFLDWEPMMTSGCKTWNPIFHNDYETTYNDPQKNSSKWMNFVLRRETEITGKDDVQLAWTDKLIRLSPYLRDGHSMNGMSGWQDIGREAIAETIYDNNWRAMTFGPNPIYAHTDTVLNGDPPTQDVINDKDKSFQEEDGLSILRDKARSENRSIDVPEINATFLASGDILVGQSLAPDYQSRLDKNKGSDIDAETISKIKQGLGFNMPGTLGSLIMTAETIYDWFKDEDGKTAKYLSAYEKKFRTAVHPNASKFAGSKEDGIRKMAELTAGIAKGNKTKDLSVRRAFPTFKIYFIEDDSHQTGKDSNGQVIKAFDDFYSLSAIQEIRISRSRKNAADLATIRMTNIGGKLLRKRWGQREEWVDKENEINGTEAEYATGIFADTELENPFSRMVLQDGVKVQIRLGYSNEPDVLTTVFLGSVVEMAPSEGGKIIEIVCQGFGAELEGVELGPVSDGEVFYSSQQVLSGAVIQDSIVNFGRRSKYNKFNPGATRQKFIGGEGEGLLGTISNFITMQEWKDRSLFKFFYRYPFRNLPQDDNIFAPPPSTYANFWQRFWNNACLYRPIKQTPWDIFKEHELRHPGYISLAVPYGHEPRMTMFFGAKAQHYWAHPPSMLEIYLSEHVSDDIIKIRGMNSEQRTSDQLLGKLDKLLKVYPKLTGVILRSLVQDMNPANAGKEIGRLFGRYRPFRNYHYFDSYHHILKNTIRTNTNGVANEVEVLYFENENNIQDEDAEDLYDNIKSMSLGEHGKYSCKLDENIPEQYIRSYTAEFPSCVTEFMAKRYAQGLFARLLRDSYKGELIVMGEPTLKPYDVIYMNDASVNMTGPIEVEGVEHIFNRDHGWISIITPDLCIDVNDFFSMTLFSGTADAMANIWNNTSSDIEKAMTALASPIGFLGVMAGVKMAMWMQDGSPVVATPLTLGGKPFVSVLLGQDRVSLITSLKGKWNQYWDDLTTGWDRVDVGETIFEETLDFQEWFYTIFNSSTEGLEEA